jgi:hypothetical protein
VVSGMGGKHELNFRDSIAVLPQAGRGNAVS